MKKTVLREYAKLIVKCGVNVQKGQEVLIFADLDQPEFVKMVVKVISYIFKITFEHINLFIAKECNLK